MMKCAIQTTIFWMGTFFLLGCGAPSQTQTETIPVAVPPSADVPEVTQRDPEPQSADTDIEETKEVKVDLTAQLRAHYQEMALPDDVISVLAEARVEFVIPDLFEKAAAVKNDFWQYDYGLVARSGKVEVRFKVLPGENTGTTMSGNKVNAANELINVIIRLNGAELVADIQEHPKSEASSRFNASSYTTGTFQPVPGFSSKQIASAGLIYKEGYGRVIVVTLMDSMEDDEARTEWITGANALRFVEEPVE
ncbi:MAG: hypothetical protein JXR76_27065 [Deltaproteobacteria bacterium]|nr:hypothetical protein [Deltaproteobacteria bacterium]